jgi:hypothetical protein
VGRGAIAEMLARQGIEPAPERERKTTWKEFLTQHWDLIVAAVFSPSKPGRDAAYSGLSSCFHGIVDPQGGDRRDHVESQWVVDESTSAATSRMRWTAC